MPVRITGFLPTSFQRVLLDILRDASTRYFPAFSGEVMTADPLFSTTPNAIFYGSGLTLDPDLGPIGTIHRIKLIPDGETSPVVVLKGFHILLGAGVTLGGEID